MSATVKEEATTFLSRLAEGDEAAAACLLPLVYDELRALAQHYFDAERRDHTLEPTALVHEAYLRLIDQTRVQWESRGHFFATAATAMRRILTDYARRKRAAKRGGRRERITACGLPAPSAHTDDTVDVVALDDALQLLAELDPRQHRVVELRFFGGLSVEDTAALLDLSKTTVEREWRMARAWLSTQLRKTPEE